MLDDIIELILCDGERQRQRDRVAVHAARKQDHAVLEAARQHPWDELRVGLARAAVSYELDANHHAFAAHLAKVLVAGSALAKAIEQDLTQLVGTFHEAPVA